MFWRLSKSHIEDYLHGEDPWALVTGSTDGIGKAIANALLSKGFNLVLHGRTPSKLSAVQAELQSSHPTRKIRTVLADFNDISPASLDAIPRFLQENGLTEKVNIFINNVAATDVGLRLFVTGEMRPTEWRRTLNAGVVYFTELCAKILPMMVEGYINGSQTGPKMMVNIGSAAGNNAIPFVAVYSATKGYMLALTRSLSLETQLIPNTSCPLSIIYADVHSVSTHGNPTPPSFFVPTADQFAKSLIEVIGRRRFLGSKSRGSGAVVTPYWTHQLETIAMNLFPKRVMEWVVMKRMSDLKKLVDEKDKKRT